MISFHLFINGLCHIAVDAFHLPFSMGFGCRHYVTASDTLEKVEQSALAVCGDYFLYLPDFDPEKEADGSNRNLRSIGHSAAFPVTIWEDYKEASDNFTMNLGKRNRV